MTRISSSRMDMEGGRVDNAFLKDYGETLVGGALGTNTTSTYTVDLSTGNVFNLILTANCTFTFSNAPAAGVHGAFTLVLRQDDAGGRTATWPAAVVWPSGTTPSLTTSPGGVDMLNFVTYDGGNTWFGFLAAYNVSSPPTWFTRGYFAGGNSPAVSSIDRVDYSNDTATATVKGPLSATRTSFTATGNSSFGYFGGGGSPVKSSIDRVDYSSDTATATVKGPLSSATRSASAATGNAAFGYFGGGGGTPTTVTTVDRIDYSNDTATAAVKGPLSAARYYIAATGNSSFGYFGGGADPTFFTTVDRVDYSNDTAAAAVKGPLSLARYNAKATGNSSFGYFSGGNQGRTTLDRIDYSNDTATATVKGPLSSTSVAGSNAAATGNSAFGYFAGGSGTVSTVDRIDYSNDTAAAAVTGPLSLPRTSFAATNHAALS